MIARLAESLDMDVRIVAYVRPQYQYFEARYAQWVKDAAHWLPFNAFVAASFALRPVEQHPWLNYARVFARWRAAFGGRLSVVPLEPTRLPRGLLGHFLDQLGVRDLDPGPVGRRNERPGAKAVQVHRLVTAGLVRRGRNLRKHRAALRRMLRGQLAADTPFAGFSAADAHGLMARFAAENAAFARAYAIDPDGVLFRDTPVDDRARPNVATWEYLDDGERAAVRDWARRTVGFDPAPRRRHAVRSAAARPRPPFGSTRWHRRRLLDPRLAYWCVLLNWLLRRKRILA